MRKIFLCLVAAGILAISGCGGGSDTDSDVDMTDVDDMAVDDGTVTATESDADMDPDESAYDDDVYSEPVVDPAPQYGPNDIVMAITDRDMTVRLVLTPSNLSMRLTRDMVDKLESRVNERGLGDDLKKALLESVEEVVREEIQTVVDQGVKKTLGHRIVYPLSNVNSVFYRDGRLWIDLEREKPLSFDDIRTRDGRPVLANFEESDALAFVQAFESLQY